MYRFAGQLAHNILADGRWFSRNEAAEVHIRALAIQRKHLVDPASIDYNGLNRSDAWVPEISESVGISVVIAGLWAITGDERYIEVDVLQAVVDSFVALLIYWISTQLFRRRRPALVAASLYALYPPIAWQTADPYNDIWAIDFTAAIVALYLLALRAKHRWRWWIACGVCTGLGAYFRPQVLLIIPALALATAFSTGGREALRRILLVVLVASLIIAPYTIRNYKDFNAFIPMRSGFWTTVWGGFEEISNNFGEDFSNATLHDIIHPVYPDLVPNTPAWDSHVKPYVIRIIERHPFWYLELLAHRAAMATAWQFEPYWMHIEAGKWSRYKGSFLGYLVSHPLDTLEDALEPAVFLLGMLSLCLAWRGRRRQHAILIALALAVILPYIPVHVEARYLLPAVPAYVIWIGLGADYLIERVAGRSRRSAGRPAERSALGFKRPSLAPRDHSS
jgi:4-amino-4-deoxy-L-arabinose transferase-like glycosyltransferase